MEPILLTLKPGGSTCPDTPHEGEEFGYILQGSVSIHLGKKTYKAKKGESFYYTADKQHYLSSKGSHMGQLAAKLLTGLFRQPNRTNGGRIYYDNKGEENT